MTSRVKAIILIFLGSVSWSLTMVKSGLPTEWGLGFWGANGHDGIWHIALSNSLARGTLEMPTFAGSRLQNYHIGFDVILAALHNLTKISIPTLYFQIIPPILAVSIGILAYVFVKQWKKSESVALWSTFFLYFGGSFGWIVTLLRGEGLGGESMFWSQQAISTLINPPFALSLIFLLGGFIFLQKYFAKPKLLYLLFASFLFGSLIEIKAYAGVLVLGALFVGAIYSAVFKKSKQRFALLCVFITSLIISVALFLPLNGAASSLIQFSPFWFLDTMLALSDRFYWPKLYNALFNWRGAHQYPKLFAGYSVALLLFILGNFGTRLVGVIPGIGILKQRKLDVFDVMMGSILCAATAAPLLFVQQGTAWNTIQFFYYALFILSIYAGVTVSLLVSRSKLLVVLVVFLTIPSTISTLQTVYLPGRPPASIPAAEMEALQFLSKQPLGVVFTYPFDGYKAREALANPPRPLYLYDSTAYVSAYSNKPVFLEDEVNLTIMGYEWKERRAMIEDFYTNHDHAITRNFLRKHNISYVYWVKPQRAVPGDLQLGLQQIFENKDVYIYRVIQ